MAPEPLSPLMTTRLDGFDRLMNSIRSVKENFNSHE